jgi:hypothetical protein
MTVNYAMASAPRHPSRTDPSAPMNPLSWYPMTARSFRSLMSPVISEQFKINCCHQRTLENEPTAHLSSHAMARKYTKQNKTLTPQT